MVVVVKNSLTIGSNHNADLSVEWLTDQAKYRVMAAKKRSPSLRSRYSCLVIKSEFWGRTVTC